MAEMPYTELLGWFDYFKRRPYGWQSDDRCAKLLQAQGVKAKPQDLFSSLQTIYKPANETVDEDGLSTSSLKGSYLLQKLMTSTGGEKLSYEDKT